MSANGEVIRRAFQAWNDAWDTGRPSEELDRTWGDFYLPEFEFRSHVTGLSTGGQAYRGKEGSRTYVDNLTEAFDTYRLGVDRMVELDDDRVLALGRVHYVGRGSGIESELMVGWIFTVRDGRIAKGETIPDHAAALKAAGLSDRE